MATRKSTPRKPATKLRNPELAQAADNLSEAAHHVGVAMRQKFEEIGHAASAEFAKVMDSARIKRGQAKRQLDALMKKTEVRLKKATADARKSLQQAAKQAEKRMAATKKAAKASLADLQAGVTTKVAGKKAAPKRSAAKSTATKPTAAKKVSAKPAATPRAPASKAAGTARKATSKAPAKATTA
jgi:hypothetical protein